MLSFRVTALMADWDIYTVSSDLVLRMIQLDFIGIQFAASLDAALKHQLVCGHCGGNSSQGRVHAGETVDHSEFFANAAPHPSGDEVSQTASAGIARGFFCQAQNTQPLDLRTIVGPPVDRSANDSGVHARTANVLSQFADDKAVDSIQQKPGDHGLGPGKDFGLLLQQFFASQCEKKVKSSCSP